MQKGKCITCEAEILGFGYCSKECSEKAYTEEIEGWNNVLKNPPTELGWYNIKTIMGEYEAPFIHNGKGELVWLLPDLSILTHWKQKG